MAKSISRGVLGLVVGVVVLAGIGWCSDSGDPGAGGVADSGSPDASVVTTETRPTPRPGSPSPAPLSGSVAPTSGDAAPAPSTGGQQSAADPLVAPARAALPGLAVKGRAPRTGYDRDLFGQAWSDDVSAEFGRNGCDTRNDILGRDLREITYRPGTGECVVLTGVLMGPYTGERIEFERGRETSTEVQIDHVVAMSDAWQKGARQLSEQQRQEFANDPLNLLAVDGETNQQKGAGDTATWLPPQTGFRCSYVARQVLVKERYDLWVTAAERDAMERILSACG